MYLIYRLNGLIGEPGISRNRIRSCEQRYVLRLENVFDADIKIKRGFSSLLPLKSPFVALREFFGCVGAVRGRPSRT